MKKWTFFFYGRHYHTLENVKMNHTYETLHELRQELKAVGKWNIRLHFIYIYGLENISQQRRREINNYFQECYCKMEYIIAVSFEGLPRSFKTFWSTFLSPDQCSAKEPLTWSISSWRCHHSWGGGVPLSILINFKCKWLNSLKMSGF